VGSVIGRGAYTLTVGTLCWMRPFPVISLVLVTLDLGLGRTSSPGPTTPSVALPGSVLLPIPNLNQDPNAPSEGWCGEACIQMVLAYCGREATQAVIHAAGHTTTPDLESPEDMPRQRFPPPQT